MLRIWIILISVSLSGCYFFRKKNTGEGLDENQNPILGTPLGAKAGGPDYASLDEIYGITTDHAPASIRPDPDTYIRNILLQYREEGPIVAQEIGRVEQYRLLLGGANEDFSKPPQDRYDATSLLASLKVAEEICLGLVAPEASLHGDWQTILPEDPDRVTDNVRFLAQRFIGLPSDSIDESKITALEAIYNEGNDDGQDSYADYIPVCTTLAIDAEGLLL